MVAKTTTTSTSSMVSADEDITAEGAVQLQLRRTSNALHDAAVRLHQSRRFNDALETYNESIRIKLESVKVHSNLHQSSSEEEVLSGMRADEAARDLLARREDEEESRRVRLENREEEGEFEDQDELLSQLDVFPLDVASSSELFVPPPRRPALLLGSGDVLSSEDNQAGECFESARTLCNMALLHISKKLPRPANLRNAELYLALVEEAWGAAGPSTSNRGILCCSGEELLLAGDVAHTKAVISCVRGLWSDAERQAKEALRLYCHVSPTSSPISLLRASKEGEADSLSLILRVRHLSGSFNAESPATGTRKFCKLLVLRTELYGPDSMQVAATLCSLGIVLLSSSWQHGGNDDESGGQQQYGATTTMARECIEALVFHPSAAAVQSSPALTEALQALHRAEASDLLLHEVLGIVFHLHAAAA